jgi:5-methyltetrahydropteroyltriglutamate--homocysteine methyltransferase
MALDRCLQGIHVPTIVHLCYGYPGANIKQHEYQYPKLLEQLMKTRIGGFGVEFARSNYNPEVLEMCQGRLVMFGCVDPGHSPPPPVSAVVDRVREVLNYVPPEKLLLAPDCGLMIISPELARAKSQLLVDVARVLRSG